MRRLISVAATICVVTAGRAGAQMPSGGSLGSRMIATDDWMTDVIIRLRSRGYLSSLDPIAQPWERRQVARAVAAMPKAALDTVPPHVAAWFALLREELGPEFARLAGRDSVDLGFAARGGGVAATNPRIDPLLPLRKGVTPINGHRRDPRNAWPIANAEGWGERGPFAADLRLGTDITLRRADPDGRDPGRIFDVLPDNELSYVSARSGPAAVVVGRFRRNWAPIGTTGLMVSDQAIGIPQIGYELGGRNLVVRGFVSELDTLRNSERYFASHRIEYLTDDFAISLGESKVYVSSGGPGINNLNPIEVFFITGDKLGGEGPTNTALDGQLWLRRGAWTLSGEAFVDDIWVVNHAPARVAMSAAANWFTPVRWVDLDLQYRAVLSYTYWTVDEGHHNIDQLSYYGRGLGDNASDYDRWTVRANLYPAVHGLRLTPTLALQRKGQWDFRLPAVPAAQFLASSSFLQGTAEKTIRLGLAGRYQATRRAFVEWDAGVNSVSNANHVAGKSLNEFSAMTRVMVNWSAPDRRSP